MDIEEWKQKLKGAERDGWCAPGVRCEICHRAFLIDFVEILKSSTARSDLLLLRLHRMPSGQAGDKVVRLEFEFTPSIVGVCQSQPASTS